MRRISARNGRRLCPSTWLHYSTDKVSSTAGAKDVISRKKKIYVIAGEPSGDAIGAKVLHALARRKQLGDPRAQELVYKGVGGPLMTSAGQFKSLFPMEELSVMGLVEILPYLWRFRKRIQETLADIRTFQPDVILTIDSKGFTFRILKALQADPATSKSIKRMHYVAPSVWAYRHRKRQTDFTPLSQLLHRMFTILPFEDDIFLGKRESRGLDKNSWCRFVGHPAVEDFLEIHGVYDQEKASSVDIASKESSGGTMGVNMGKDALIDLSQFDFQQLERRGHLFRCLMETGRNDTTRTVNREKLGIPEDAFVICALVGSRSNEVRKSIKTVMKAIERVYQSSGHTCVIFPTISPIQDQIEKELASLSNPVQSIVLPDMSPLDRNQLFKMSDVAVAVSGTIVMETTLANLPTIVIYRANILTEIIAKQLAAVRFVSIPNLLMGRSILPELVFRDCNASNIAAALRGIHDHSLSEDDSLQRAMVLSTLTNWTEELSPKDRAGNHMNKTHMLQPIRASDIVAEEILSTLYESVVSESKMK